MPESPGSDAAPRTSPLWFLVPAAIVVGMDQWTKALIVATMSLGESRPILGQLLSLTCRSNTGGAFGIFTGQAVMLAVFGTVVVVALLYLAPRLAGGNRVALIGTGLVLGGAVGNLLDRARIGHVIDFIDFHFWPVFNVADTAITVGIGLMVIALLLHRPAAEEPESHVA
jgi:signal peptidase II